MTIALEYERLDALHRRLVELFIKLQRILRSVCQDILELEQCLAIGHHGIIALFLLAQ